MAAPDPALERLLKAERLAFERYDRLRGYPGNVEQVALALWTEATDGRKQLKPSATIAEKHP
jgi:hypothetical protein